MLGRLLCQITKAIRYFVDIRADKTTSKKPYDPAQFTEKTTQPNHLQEKIKFLEMDYKTLHDKRLQDVIKKTDTCANFLL